MNASYYEPADYNRFWLGFLAGFCFPILTFLLYFLFRFKDISFTSFVQILLQSGKYVHVISLSVFSNLIPFLFFLKSDRFKSGRGVMTITILFALTVFILKFSL